MIEPVWNQILFHRSLASYTKGRRWLDLGCGRGTRDPALVPIRSRMEETLYVEWISILDLCLSVMN